MSTGVVIATGDARKTVLVVDDAPSNIRIVNEILHKSYQVRVATNGAKALELAKAAPGPDLILLDVVMPGMDGYEVCTRLKADAATKDIPVIFLTGQTEIEDETRGFETGAVDYIHKPFSPAVVAARVQTHLALREMRQQLARQLQDLRSELETARKIQMSILPREFPVNDHLDIAARYIPASAVAGDFYDFFAIDEKRIGVLIADVSGAWHASRADRLDAEDRVRSAVRACFRSRSRYNGIEQGAVREVRGPLRDCGVRVDRHGGANDSLCGRRASSSTVARRGVGQDPYNHRERSVPRIRASRPIHGR